MDPISEGLQAPSKARSKVLIAGATGFSGRAVVDWLAQHPRYAPIAHLRPSSSRRDHLTAHWSSLGVDVLCCPWSSIAEEITRLQPQVIISLIGTTKKQARRGGGDYESVDTGLNLSLIDAAVTLAEPPRFIYLSSMGVEWARWSAYLRARAIVEERLGESGLPATIIRPGFLSGPSRDERRPLEVGGAAFARGLATCARSLSLPKLAGRVAPLDAPELAAFIGRLLEREARTIPQLECYLSHEIQRALRERGAQGSSLDQSREEASQ